MIIVTATIILAVIVKCYIVHCLLVVIIVGFRVCSLLL